MTVFCRKIWGTQSQKTAEHHWLPSFLHLVRPFEPESLPVLTHVLISAGVAQSRNSTKRPPINPTCSNWPKTSSNPGKSKYVRKKDLANGNKDHECEKETLPNCKKKYEEENNVGQRKQLILNSQNGVKNLCSLHCTYRTGKCDQLVTCLVDRRKSRISEKVVQNKTMELRNHHGSPLEESSFQLIHTSV